MCSDRLIQQLRDQREWQAHKELQEGPGLLEFTLLLNEVCERASAAGSCQEEEGRSAASLVQRAPHGPSASEVPPLIS